MVHLGSSAVVGAHSETVIVHVKDQVLALPAKRTLAGHVPERVRLFPFAYHDSQTNETNISTKLLSVSPRRPAHIMRLVLTQLQPCLKLDERKAKV